MVKERLDSSGGLHSSSSFPSFHPHLLHSSHLLIISPSSPPPLLPSFLTFSMFLSLCHHSPTLCQHCLWWGGGGVARMGGVCALLFTGSPPPSIPPSLSLSLSLRSALPPPTLLSSASNEVIPSSGVKRSESRGEQEPAQGGSSGGGAGDHVRSRNISAAYWDQLLAGLGDRAGGPFAALARSAATLQLRCYNVEPLLAPLRRQGVGQARPPRGGGGSRLGTRTLGRDQQD